MRGGVVGRRWPSHATSRTHSAPRSILLCSNLHLENSFEDNGVAGRQVLDLLALEDDVFQRYLSTQPDPTALQRSNRGKCAHLLRDLNATAVLPPRCPLLALQLLDLTYRWSESKGPDISSRPALSPTSSRLLPLLWAGANLATCHLCIRLRLCMKWWPNTASWSQ